MSVGLRPIVPYLQGSLLAPLFQQCCACCKVTTPSGLSWGLAWGPHLNSLSFLWVLCPHRLWAAAIQPAVSGGWRQGCRRRRVALAGEPPRPGPGPPVRGFPHLSHLDGVRSALLRGRQRIQVSHWMGSGGASPVYSGAGKAVCLWVMPRWGGTGAGPGLQGRRHPRMGLLTLSRAPSQRLS